MTRAIFTLAAAMAFAPVAIAGPDTDYPHRDWGQVATLDMTLDEATTCVARAMDRKGGVLVLPVEGGNDVDFTHDVAWGKRMEPWLTFKLRAADRGSTMQVFYRHPYTVGKVAVKVRWLQKRCLKVASITPVNE